jgi:LPXTG-motif cell wall-anchored protein
VSWTVQDGRGGTAPVAVRVAVGCDDLPSTGSDPMRWVRIAAIAIAAGVMLTIISRRRWRRTG